MPILAFGEGVHESRNEHRTVAEAKLLATLDNKYGSLEAGDAESIPAGTRHALENPSNKKLSEVTEVRIGRYFGEDKMLVGQRV